MYSNLWRLSVSSLSPRLSPTFSNCSTVLPRFYPAISILPVNNLTPTVCPLHTSSVVERARQSTRIKKRKQNLANKKKKEERLRKNPPPLPKKVQLMLRSKGLGSKPQPWRQPDNKSFPADTAWCEFYHTWARLEIEEAVEFMRENYHPTMYNIPDGLVLAKLEFNLQAVKKDKYIDSFTKMVPIYHPFERGVAEKVILAFCKEPEDIKAAEQAGANKAGGKELIEDIVKGKMDISDFDHFLATEDIVAELKPLVGILREKFPKKPLGTVASDIGKLVQTFAHGMLVSVNKPKRTLGFEEDPSYGVSEVQIGRLTQTTEQLRGNLTTILDTLTEQAPKRKSGGFITRCELYVEGPLKAKYSIVHERVDDDKYKDHMKEMSNADSVQVLTKLETIKEEVHI